MKKCILIGILISVPTLTLIRRHPKMKQIHINQTARHLMEEFDTDNQTFMASHPKSWFEQFEKGQKPRLTLLTCSDSRVQLEAFDHSAQNDTFVVRNIGNQLLLNPGSVLYGIQFLKTPVLIIMGHSGCGAVKAALEDVSSLTPILRRELKNINVSKHLSLQEAVIENVHNQIAKALIRFGDQVQNNELTIIGMVYDFKNDYHKGYGRIILVNVNGEKDSQKLQDLFPKSTVLTERTANN